MVVLDGVRSVRASITAARIAHWLVVPSLKRLNDRADWWALGHFPIRSGDAPQKLHIGGQIVPISTPAGEADHQQWELNHLYRDDPYNLAVLPGDVSSILDIGANIGLFSMLARHYFPKATIHAYEPAPSVFENLRCNTETLDIETFQAGVAGVDGRADMVGNGRSLDTQMKESPSGAIELVSIRSAMDKLGSTVDLLKMDCEGGEWSILRDRACLSRARYVAMEYHLTGPHCLNLWELVKLFKEEGFQIESLRESSNRVVGQLTAVNLGLQRGKAIR